MNGDAESIRVCDIVIHGFPVARLEEISRTAEFHGVPATRESVIRWALFQFGNMTEQGINYHCCVPKPASASTGPDSHGT